MALLLITQGRENGRSWRDIK